MVRLEGMEGRGRKIDSVLKALNTDRWMINDNKNGPLLRNIIMEQNLDNENCARRYY